MAKDGNSAEQQLSQAEVDALLSQVSADPAAPAEQQEKPVAPAPVAGPKRYDFREPSFLSSTDLRKLRQRYEDFAHSVVTRLSIYLRLDFSIAVSGIETMSGRRFMDEMASPTQLTLFRVEPLFGVGVVEINSSLGMSIVDRLLGGPGTAMWGNSPPGATGAAAEVKREMSEIEVAILDLALTPILREWTSVVTELPDAKAIITGHEVNPRYLQDITPETSLLAVSMDVRMNEAKGTIKIGVPARMIDPILQQIQAQTHKVTETNAPVVQQPCWSRELGEVPVPVSAFWNDLEITMRDLARLKVGDVLEVGPGMANRVSVCVSHVPKYVGRLGTREHTWAVELTSRVK